jgi:SP family sugar:H+ symporter-like MFS transporter
MVGFLTPLATDGVGGSPGIKFAYGYVFAGTNFVAGLLVWFFLYESRTLSLENVDLMYGQDGIKPWTSHKWVPPGYITRKERDEGHFRNMSVSGPAGNGHMASEKKSSDNSEEFLHGTARTEHV